MGGTTPNRKYGDLSQAVHYVLRGLKHHTEVTNTMVSIVFPCNPLIGHAEEVLRAACEMCETIDTESVVMDTMRNCSCSDIDTSPATPVTPEPRSTGAIDTEDSYDIIQMDVESGPDVSF